MTDHAAALLSAFIAPERRERYLTLLACAKGQAELRQRLAHLRDLDQRYARLLPPGEHTVPAIASRLRAAGAPATCYLLAADEALDGRERWLEDALEAVIGRGMGAFVSCLARECNQHFGAKPVNRYGSVQDRRRTVEAWRREYTRSDLTTAWATRRQPEPD